MATPRKKKTDIEPPTEAGIATAAPETTLCPGETQPELPPTDANGTTAETPPLPNGNGGERRPAYKVGPIATDRNNAVSAAVWENEHTTQDGRTFKVHNVTVEARWRDASGEWKSGKSYRGSQLYALIYCLQRASDFILSQRDPQTDCPF